MDGRIDPATDIDFFVFDLSDQPGPTDVWIYTTGDLDSLGGLFDSNLDLLWVNDDSRVDGRFRAFQIRAILEPDYYFVLVRSWRSLSVGDYTLHIEPVVNPSDSSDTPTQLELSVPIPGRFDARRETHHFRFDITEQTNVFMRAETPIIRDGDRKFFPFMPLDPTILDADGAEVSVNIYALVVRIISTGDRFRFGFIIQDDFAPGSYTLELTTPADDYETTYPGFYTIQAFEDVVHNEFIENCEGLTEAIDDPSVADPLYACQWHLDQPNGEDVNVKPVWDDGLMGEGINVAVVDTGMDWTHEDLVDNVDSSLNHDYTGEGDIHHPYSHHGTNVAGLIAARDNDIGVRGVAPRATIYGHNLLDAPLPTGSDEISDFDIAHAAGNNSGVTAVSNNSWGPVDGPEAEGAPALWELAIENGVTRGYDGRGVFYVWAAGNGHLRGDDSNLDGLANFYAVTAACAVNEARRQELVLRNGRKPLGMRTLQSSSYRRRLPRHRHHRELRPLHRRLRRHLRRDPYRLRRRRPRPRGQPGPHLARPQAHPRRNCPQERSHKPRLAGRRAHVRPRLRCRPLPLQPRVRLRCR